MSDSPSSSPSSLLFLLPRMGLSAKEYGLDPGILQFSQMRCLPRLGRRVLGWLGGWWVCVGGKGQGGSYDQETKTGEVGMA